MQQQEAAQARGWQAGRLCMEDQYLDAWLDGRKQGKKVTIHCLVEQAYAFHSSLLSTCSHAPTHLALCQRVDELLIIQNVALRC